MNLKKNLIRVFSLFALACLFLGSCTQKWVIQDPYETVNWNNHKQYKANFHAHTTVSDGRMNPHSVVDKYKELGYQILAITDHNAVTYPWTGFSSIEASKTSVKRMVDLPEEMPENLTYEDRNPNELGMIDIQGNEFSRHHHTGSYFNGHGGTKTEEESFQAIAAKGGIAILNHPGRYRGSYRREHLNFYSIDWYAEQFKKHDHLIGLEVYNQGDRYPEDRQTWDSILSVTMPERPVWGYSNDDMHFLEGLGYNWNMMILPGLTHEWVRHGMENGLCYFVHAPEGHDGPPVPVIQSIKVDDKRGTIEISALKCDSIKWITGGKVLASGSKIDLKDIKEDIHYIRAELYGKGKSVVGSQPFGLIKR
ncbi:MAG: hypothetical protein RBS73_08630 [Prolixibacteraceae bacterium]|nr:hypothetical protein [Prolixibacteraceae bacterium]